MFCEHILFCRLSLAIQADSVTIGKVGEAVETTFLSLTSMRNMPGPQLDDFLRTVEEGDGRYKGQQLTDFNQGTKDEFDR